MCVNDIELERVVIKNKNIDSSKQFYTILNKACLNIEEKEEQIKIESSLYICNYFILMGCIMVSENVNSDTNKVSQAFQGTSSISMLAISWNYMLFKKIFN